MNEDIKHHLQVAKKLFEQKLVLDTRNQEIAQNFYIERADFTISRSIGDVFADHLYTSYPLVASRELSDMVGSLLRPKSSPWFSMALLDERYEDHASRSWMQHKTEVMRRAMYNPDAMFQRATKEADRDYVNFGNAVISVEPNKNRSGLLYRNWHLRDVAWSEDAYGKIDSKYCKRKLSIKQLKQMFGEKCHSSIKTCKDESKEINIMHVVVPNHKYGGSSKLKNVSIYIDVDNSHELECVPLATEYYLIPRWATISGSQYAYSPAMIAGLPDARLFQDMTRTIMEAGEKAVNPPMIAQEEAIRSDISIFAGGITYVDSDYNERLGEVLRPLNIDRSGIPLGLELADRTQQALAKALYLDKFSLPSYNEMTAREAVIRNEEHIRSVMPIFEPMEEEYSARVCQETFDVMWRMGWLGSMYDIPESMQRAREYQFKFISPISSSEDSRKTSQFMATVEIIQAAASITPSFVNVVNINKAGRDAIQGAGAKEDWLNSEEDVAAMEAEQQEQQMAAQMMSAVGQGAEVLQQVKAING
jgi:hypothetical protein